MRYMGNYIAGLDAQLASFHARKYTIQDYLIFPPIILASEYDCP